MQLTTKMRLSSFSCPAIERSPIDSGSSISPSPMNAQILRPEVSLIPRPVRYFMKCAWEIAMSGPSPIETVGNCQKSGISHGCG